jgi:hypothetical protein
MNVEIGTEAAQLLFWEHINEVFVAVREGGGREEQCWFTCCAHGHSTIQFAGLSLIKCVPTDLVLFTLCVFISQLGSRVREGKRCPVRCLPATEREVA